MGKLFFYLNLSEFFSKPLICLEAVIQEGTEETHWTGRKLLRHGLKTTPALDLTLREIDITGERHVARLAALHAMKLLQHLEGKFLIFILSSL